MVTLTDDKPEATLPNDHTADQHGLPPDYSEAIGTQAAHQDEAVPPPSFSEQGVSPSSNPSSSNFAPLTRPTNYLTVEKEHSPIKGTYSIDPTLPTPPGAIKSQDNDGNYLNLRLAAKHGSLSAVIDVVRGADASGPARLETSCKHGSSDITVHDRRQNRFRLRVTAIHGSATIRIPPTFIGSVHSKTQHSRTIFNKEVKEHVTTLSELSNEGRYFIGDFAANGYEDDETWHMDHLEIESEHCFVTIKFTADKEDDGDETRGKGRGFFCRLFSTGCEERVAEAGRRGNQCSS